MSPEYPYEAIPTNRDSAAVLYVYCAAFGVGGLLLYIAGQWALATVFTGGAILTGCMGRYLQGLG